MSMFILTISCLTTSSLPCFMDLTSQVPIHYCSVQHQILLLSLDTSTTEHRFCFGLAASFFLGLLVIVLSSFSIANWTPSNLWDSSFGIISFFHVFLYSSGFPRGSAGKESTCNVRDLGLIPELGRSPGEGNGYPLKYSVLENSMDCIVHGVTKSWIQLIYSYIQIIYSCIYQLIYSS